MSYSIQSPETGGDLDLRRDQTLESSDQLIRINNPFFVFSEIACLEKKINSKAEKRRVATRRESIAVVSAESGRRGGYGRRPWLLFADNEREREEKVIIVRNTFKII